MTGKGNFTEQEWDAVLQGPPAAGTIVATASKGGTFKESFAIAKAYAEARQEHGASELLDAIVSAKPKVDRHLGHSPDEVKIARPPTRPRRRRRARDQGDARRGRRLPAVRAHAREQGGERPQRGRDGGLRPGAGGDRGHHRGARRRQLDPQAAHNYPLGTA